MPPSVAHVPPSVAEGYGVAAAQPVTGRDAPGPVPFTVNAVAGRPQNGVWGQLKSTAEYSASLVRRCRALIMRTVPDFERITSDWVLAPRLS